MVNNVLITVIIPFYNDEIYIEEAINSVIRQTYFTNLELIMVDDGSRDRSSEIALRYVNNSNIFYIRQENAGQGLARNNGLSIAKGKYVYFLDSDDMITSECLELCYINAENNKADIVTFNSKVNKVDNSSFLIDYEKRDFLPTTIINGIEYLKAGLKYNKLYVPVWLYFYNIEFLRNNNITFEKVLYEDTIFTLNICLKNPFIIYIDQILHCRRIREESSMTSKRKTVRHLSGAFECVIQADKAYNLFKNIDNEMSTYLKDFITGGIGHFIKISRLLPKSDEKIKLQRQMFMFMIENREFYTIKTIIKWLIA